MRLNKMVFLLLFAVLFVTSGCNLSINLGVNETPTVLMVTVNINTEYRTGPGSAYETAGSLAAGQLVEAVGRSPDGNYLLIRDPANSEKLYWLDSSSVTMNGNSGNLPAATPPATPTPVSGCPTPIGGGPTEVNCGVSPSTGGCPTPIGGGPTPVDCSGAPSTSGCPTPIGGGPTPINCSGSSFPGLRRVPTFTPTFQILRRLPTATPVR